MSKTPPQWLEPAMPVSPCGPIDRLIGMNIRHFRCVAGLTQEALAQRLDVTFQQLQKYERAVNRISASKLFKLSVILDVPVQYFFSQLWLGECHRPGPKITG